MTEPNKRQRSTREYTLSTWGEGIVAAAVGDVVRMAELLAGEGSDGQGIDLRTFRTSWDDVDYIWLARSIRIDAHYTLVEIAVERDHFDIVNLLTETPAAQQQDEVTVPVPPGVNRAVSTFVEPCGDEVNLADLLREVVFATLTVRPAGDPLAGLPQLALEDRQVFLLAREALALPLAARQAACGSMTEDRYTQESVDDAVAWWAATVGGLLGASPEECASGALPPWGLHALYTSGDGNCLLHGALLSTVGVRDTLVPQADAPGASSAAELAPEGAQPRRALRAALHHGLTCADLGARTPGTTEDRFSFCSHARAPHRRRSCAALRALLASHGVLLAPAAGETAESRSVAHGIGGGWRGVALEPRLATLRWPSGGAAVWRGEVRQVPVAAAAMPSKRCSGAGNNTR